MGFKRLEADDFVVSAQAQTATCWTNNVPTLTSFFTQSGQINGNSGDVAIIDASMWHKAGESSNQRRLSLFSYYGPWWIKPYFNYEKMLGKNKLNKLNKNIRKLLHYNSTPPKCPEERSLTVTDYNEVIKPSKIRKKYDYGLITTRR